MVSRNDFSFIFTKTSLIVLYILSSILSIITLVVYQLRETNTTTLVIIITTVIVVFFLLSVIGLAGVFLENQCTTIILTVFGAGFSIASTGMGLWLLAVACTVYTIITGVFAHMLGILESPYLLSSANNQNNLQMTYYSPILA